MDKYGVIWTRTTGMPVKLADMVLTSSQLRITKTQEAIDLGLPGVSLLHDRFSQHAVIYNRSPNESLPPQLKALLPPRTNNPQYAILSKLLERHVNTRGMPVIEQEWEMLLFAGRNATGHLDVFRSDQDAERYYKSPAKPDLSDKVSSALWMCFKRLAEGTARGEEEIDEILEAVGPTPGVTGFNPKLLTSIAIGADNQWDGRISQSSGIPVLAKIDTPVYPGIVQLERLCYRYHENAGLRVPRIWESNVRFGGESVAIMATERFDRHQGSPAPLESVYSILRTGNPTKFSGTTDGSMENVWAAIKTVSIDSLGDRNDLFDRFALSFLTGNGDLHFENWAVLGDYRSARLSPVFDPAPMRAYRMFRSNHDLLSALSFSGIGGMQDLPYAVSGKTPTDLGERICEFGVSMGMSARHCRGRLKELMDVTSGYLDEAVEAMRSVNSGNPVAPDIDGFAKTILEIRDAVGLA